MLRLLQAALAMLQLQQRVRDHLPPVFDVCDGGSWAALAVDGSAAHDGHVLGCE